MAAKKPNPFAKKAAKPGDKGKPGAETKAPPFGKKPAEKPAKGAAKPKPGAKKPAPKKAAPKKKK